MKPFLESICLALSLCGATQIFTVPLAAQSEAPKHSYSYIVHDLGTIFGGDEASATSVNDKRQVAGYAVPAGQNVFRAFLWSGGVATDLGTLGGSGSAAMVIDGHGALAGYSEISEPDPFGGSNCPFLSNNQYMCRGLIWQDGAMFPLPTLGGNNAWSYGMNNRRQAVGSAETATVDITCSANVLNVEPAIWNHGQAHELPTFAGDPDGTATAINDRGQIVGYSGECGWSQYQSRHALLWDRGAIIDLGSLGGSYNIPYHINNKTQIVGESSSQADLYVPRGFLWENGIMTDLGSLPSYNQDFSSANSINDRSQIVGNSCSPQGCSAVVWIDGVIHDLNTLIPSDSTLYLSTASDINDRGDIVGTALDLSTWEEHAYIATPTGRRISSRSSEQIEAILNDLPQGVREVLKKQQVGRLAVRPPR